jgi:hypothetical protein
MPRKRWNDTVVELVKELEALVRSSPVHDSGWTVTLHNDPAEPHIDRQGY